MSVECYGVTQRIAGADPVSLTLPVAATVADALNALGERHDALRPLLPSCACARGTELLLRSMALQDGDVLALLPPVAGG